MRHPRREMANVPVTNPATGHTYTMSAVSDCLLPDPVDPADTLFLIELGFEFVSEKD